MDNDAKAQAAIKDLNDSDMQGRKIAVSVARPREERPSNGGGFSRGGGFNRSNDRRGGFDRGGRR